MSIAPFAAIEARLNAAVERRLANAAATYQGGEPFGVLFYRGQTDSFGGDGMVTDSTAHSVSLNLAHTPGLAEGSELVIDGVRYVVGQGVQGDSSGWVSGLSIFPKG